MEQHQDLIDAIIANIDGEFMKRDWELMGKIFTAIEADRLEEFLEQYENDNPPPEDCEWGQSKAFKNVLKHLEMLIDAGYIKGVEVHANTEYSYGLFEPRITLQGYDYADIVKDHALLRQTVNAIKEAGLMVSWETLKQFAPVVIKKAAQRFANKILNE